MDIFDIDREIRLKEQFGRAFNESIPNEWKPERIVNYEVPQFYIPEVRSKKCTKAQLSKVLAFIDYIKYFRCSDCCTGNMPIPTTSKWLLSIYVQTCSVHEYRTWCPGNCLTGTR